MNWTRIKLWLGVKPKGGSIPFHGHVVDETPVWLGPRDSGDDAVTDAIIRGSQFIRSGPLYEAMRDAHRMELLRAQWHMRGMRSEVFEEIAEQVITDSRHRDWDWETVLKIIENRCTDELYGPLTKEVADDD